MSQIGIIIGREFNERVRKKSFIITTLLMPVLFAALMAAPTLIMQFSRGETKHIAVIDTSGLVLPALESDSEIIFEPTDLSLEEARKQLSEHFGVLWIGSNILTDANNVKLYTNSSSSMAIESGISHQIESILEAEKLRAFQVDNLEQILDQVRTSVSIQTFRNDESQEEDSQAHSSMVSMAIGFILGMMLYMFLILYGAMVMQSVIEEKNSRVLEVMVSSVRPFDLMMGKILGIAAVAVVQILLWGVLLLGMVAFVLPHLMPADLLSGAQSMQAGADLSAVAATAGVNPEMMHALSTVMDFGYMAMIFGYLVLFLVGGYLLYSAMFAAVGSSVDSIQDAQQLQTPIMIPIILALIVAMSVIKDPNSTLAFWASIIPLTSPIVMIARIPCGIPTWEIVLSLVLLYASFVVMVWVAAKIYRVGIFMYGKKPGFKELWKWMRYKY